MLQVIKEIRIADSIQALYWRRLIYDPMIGLHPFDERMAVFDRLRMHTAGFRTCLRAHLKLSPDFPSVTIVISP